MMVPEQDSHEQYEQALAEHQQLRTRLEETEVVIQAMVAHAGQAADMLTQLATQLTAHFAAEEKGGYFQDLVDQAPHVENRTKALLEEHAVLAQQVQQLTEQARKLAPESDSAGAIADVFSAFSKKLLKHEHAENALIQEVYTRDIGSKD